MKLVERSILVTFLIAIFVVLYACSGGGGGAPPVTSTPIISEGTMTTGSVIVNGIRFEDTGADITADDGPKILGDGMTVKVKGRRNNDGVTGTADRIDVENEVRGSITSKGTDSFVVLDQTVFVDDRTIYDNVTGFAALTVGDAVEVHGQRNVNGDIVATRVEKIGGDQAQVQDEVRGIVSNKDGTPNTFTIGALLIGYDANTVIVPAGAIFADGDLVEVHLDVTSTPPLATRIELEDLEDDEFDPAEGQEFEVEGFVTDFTGLSNTFLVNGQIVQLAADVRFEGGIDADLDNNVKVEAEGHLIGGTLVADKITFKETIRIESNADGNNSADVLGKTIVVNSHTEVRLTGGIAGIGLGDGLKIRGFLNRDGVSITATRIDGINPVDADKHILQGPVSNIDGTARTFEIAGITVDASSIPANEIQNDNDQVITIDQFFGLLTENRTIVKVRGTFSGSTITANKMEIE